MNRLVYSIGMVTGLLYFQAGAETLDTATCGAMSAEDPCRISWNFSRSPGAYYSVDQFDPQRVMWRTLARLPAGTQSQGVYEVAVDSGFLYRVSACEDSEAEVNCSRSTMVWAPIVPSKDQMHLIPSRVPLVGTEVGSERLYSAIVSKENGWIDAVTQYNMYLMTNAVARSNIADMPDMTPVKDIRTIPPDDPIEVVQFNVYWSYAAMQGNPLDTPILPHRRRPPHEHPERQE